MSRDALRVIICAVSFAHLTWFRIWYELLASPRGVNFRPFAGGPDILAAALGTLLIAVLWALCFALQIKQRRPSRLVQVGLIASMLFPLLAFRGLLVELWAVPAWIHW